MRRALAISAVFVPFVLAAVGACVGEDATTPPPTGDSGPGGPPPPPPPPGTPPPSPADAGNDAPPSKPCSPKDAFTFAGPVLELDGTTQGAIDVDARLSPDELTVYWTSNRATGGATTSIWTATRSSPSAQFSGLAQVAIPSTGTVSAPSPAPHPSTLYFATYTTIGGAARSFISYSTLSGATWSTPTNVTAANVLPLGSPIGAPYVSRDLFTLVYDGFGPGGNTAIYELDRPTTGDDFGGQKQLTELGSSDSQGTPVLSQDKLAIYFATNRAHADAGAPNYYEIWVATRATTMDAFGTPLPVQGANINDQSDTRNEPTWISDDQCTMYFNSNRYVSASNNNRVFKATRPAPM